VGQEFQNHYEATKYQAEGLVRRFEAAGCRGFIYRSGNVSGHSRTGRFQRNARDNRLVQFLAACAKLGQLPRALGEPVVLSPIDEVAAGIVAISLDGASAGGVYHVDSMQPIGMDRLFGALRSVGIRLEASPQPDFLSLFSAARDTKDADLALGYFWATRKPRNVRYNHERTHQVLQRLGHGFRTLDDAWLTRFVQSLADAGVFASGPRKAHAAVPCAERLASS
jgi:thioester reductase-like protein